MLDLYMDTREAVTKELFTLVANAFRDSKAKPEAYRSTDFFPRRRTPTPGDRPPDSNMLADNLLMMESFRAGVKARVQNQRDGTWVEPQPGDEVIL